MSPADRPRALRRLLIAECISSLGSRMTLVALPWFVLATTGSATMTGIAFVAESLPVAVFGLLSGPWVGRLGALRAMVVSDWSRAALIGAIPALHLAGLLSFPLLLVLVFAASVFYVPHFGGQRIALSDLSPSEAATVSANGWLESAQQGAAVVGPAVAGVLIALLGPAEVLIVDALTFALSAALVSPLAARVAPVAGAVKESASGVLAGFRALRRDGPLSALAASSFFIDLTYLPAAVVALPVYIRDQGEPAWMLGALLAFQALGAFGGALMLSRLSRRFPAAWLVVLGSAVQVVSFAGLALGAPLWVAAATMLVGGTGNTIARSAVMTMVARRSPAAVRPHVVTTYITIVIASQPLGAAIGGPVVSAFGPRPLFWAVMAAFAFGAVVAAFVARAVGRERAVAPTQTAAGEGLRSAA